MTNAVRMGVIGAGVAVALALLALGIFMTTFDINNYRGAIARIVAEKTGRELTFGGDISLTLFPRLGVGMEKVSLSDAPGFGDAPMLTVGKARLDVRILPLFSGKVRFGHLDLQDALLTLRRDKSGRTNWDDLTSRAAKTGEKPTQGPGAEDGAPGSFDLEIEGVSVTGSGLAWIDQASNTAVSLRNVTLSTETITRGAPFGVSLRCEVSSGTPALTGSLELEGSVAMAADSAGASLGAMTLRAVLAGESVPGGRADISARADSVRVDLRESAASGHAVRVDGLRVTAYGATARASGSVTGLGADARLTASVGLDRFDARKTLAALGVEMPETADPQALTRAEATAALVVDAGGFEVRELEGTIDDTTFSGSLSSRASEVAARDVVRLSLDTLDLDRYLPPRKAGRGSGREAEPGGGPRQGGGAETDLLIDAARLRELSLDLQATAKSLRVAGARMADVQVFAGARHGLVRISPVRAALYGGSAAVGLTVNAVTDHPASDAIIGVDRVDVGGLSRDVLGEAEYQGQLSLNAALTSQGARRDAMLRSMNGRFTLSLADGVFPGVDLLGLATAAHESRSRGQGDVEAARTDTTRFGSITATGVITNGVLRSRDLEVKAPALRADGQGEVDLPSGRIDSLIKVKLVPTAQGQGGKASEDLYGVMVPIRVTGTLDQPRYRVSIAEYVKALGGAVLDTAGSVVEGVTGVLKGVGKAIVGGEGSKEEGTEGKRGLFGIF